MPVFSRPEIVEPGEDSFDDPLDVTDLLPSSPSQTYLNLLILEATLRSQYLSLLARRRQNSFVLTVLSIWITYFVYAQWFRPREDGLGVGGSVYWLVDATEKVALVGGLVMASLFWMTGQWERGVRWPRRWLALTNRGLRVFNCKLVVLPRPWWRELLASVYWVVPYAFFISSGMDYHLVDSRLSDSTVSGSLKPVTSSIAGIKTRRSSSSAGIRPNSSTVQYIEEDLAPGGDHVKLVLLPKPFTPDFREKWEIFRSDYWQQENERRARLRKLFHSRNRQVRKAQGLLGWFRFGRSQAPVISRRLHSRSSIDQTLRQSAVPQGHSRQSSVKSTKSSTGRRKRKNSSVSQSSGVALPTVTLPDEEPASFRIRGPSRSASPEIRQRTWSNSTAGSNGSVALSTSSRQGRRRPTTPLVEVANVRSTLPGEGVEVDGFRPSAMRKSLNLHPSDVKNVVQRRSSRLSVASSAVITDPSSAEDEAGSG